MRTREDFVRNLDVLRAGTSRYPIVRSRAILADYDSALARIEELEAALRGETECLGGSDCHVYFTDDDWLCSDKHPICKECRDRVVERALARARREATR